MAERARAVLPINPVATEGGRGGGGRGVSGAEEGHRTANGPPNERTPRARAGFPECNAQRQSAMHAVSVIRDIFTRDKIEQFTEGRFLGVSSLNLTILIITACTA